MAYGVQVLTSTGTMETDVLNTIGVCKIINCTGQEGTWYVPEFDSTQGFFFQRIDDSYFIQTMSFNNSTKVFTWSKSVSETHSSDFLVFFFRGVL